MSSDYSTRKAERILSDDTWNPVTFLVHGRRATASDGTVEPVRVMKRSAGRLLDGVPCDGCTRCCHGDAVRLLASDDLRKYQTEPHPYMTEARVVAHKPNGDCLYLGDEGCTIHDMKPQMCRDMDCRRIAMAITWTQARKAAAGGMLRMEVWRRGKELLARLERIDREDSLAILGGGYRCR